jgi:hypothetical protein
MFIVKRNANRKSCDWKSALEVLINSRVGRDTTLAEMKIQMYDIVC